MNTTDTLTFYKPNKAPAIYFIPSTPYIYILGEGNPNEEAFGKAVEALYTLTYAVRMSYKSKNPPLNYTPYKVFPLSGVWDLIDYTKPLEDKDNYKYTLMIEQPTFLTEGMFHDFLTEAKRKKNNPYLDKLNFGYIEEGLVCQMLHVGPFEEEPTTFALMHDFVDQTHKKRLSMTHKEIYLSDPRRTEKSKLKTLLRIQVIDK